MSKFKLLMIWCLVLGMLTSCSKDEEGATPNTAEDYWPTTAGSTWNYGGMSPYTARVTGNTKDFEGKTYREFETQQGNTINKSYLLKDKDGVYKAIGFMPNTGEVEITFLKPESAVGKPWVQSFTMNGVLTTITMSIEQKDITKTVENKIYDNVVNVKAVYTYSYMGQDLGIEFVVNYYFAKGIGLILTDLGEEGSIPLLSYDIK
ncbi:hypothetical protein H8S95_03080 [Pontibacter sp. KCTC 32443]|uniref:hypothetical protein n=1 Tax=Pontibacter TaxID=323449 RepID=UPI00164E905D|nr:MULTISPECIES: hypothetical protein [Pontibacter]MBC5773035.1 hypothetical protein [Pontibacter sp. KCTC 32443]